MLTGFREERKTADSNQFATGTRRKLCRGNINTLQICATDAREFCVLLHSLPRSS